ncbi:hypothetical protein HG535_0C03080 [Zygotorulaspora mrakii]|uniref:Uncharacterized protein n=1 Tax=Zygotorulaspora mrakii TaxID=42260 RepID=A0A7H9B0D8_ZYGMR|nr:uncharacterized protein HG535_0C03080 [Zygotorulaspora mrakii]QLG71956.1 hypothetical protein HG535_0C03080 [Zygotorulaspora mrakii]
MENTSQSRILEPIDSNSLSLISLSSASNLQENVSENLNKPSFIRPVSPPLFESAETSQNKWQFDRKEFAFESNSTPSKKTDSILQPLIHNRKRRSQLMGAKPRVPSKLQHTTSKLHHATSKLDLLDENKLTTLPICPPRGSERSSLNVKRLKLNPVNEIRIHTDMENRRISYGIPLLLAGESGNDDEDGEENEHPIVLIEDYIKYSGGPHERCTKKKVSIADLKSKMSKRKDMHIPIKLKTPKTALSKSSSSSLTLTPYVFGEESTRNEFASGRVSDNQTLNGNERSSNNDNDYDKEDACENEVDIGVDLSNVSDSVRNILDVIMKPKTQENDKYLSNLRIQSQLRTCVICDSPLYEISSLISDADDFKEIVCGNCTEKYEEAAKVFENYEFETSGEISIDSSLSSMNSALELTHGETSVLEEPVRPATPTMTLQTQDRFSQELIRRLQVQSQRQSSSRKNAKDVFDCPTMAWFLDAKKKIRWRWRASGLLPRFLTNHYDSKHMSSN